MGGKTVNGNRIRRLGLLAAYLALIFCLAALAGCLPAQHAGAQQGAENESTSTPSEGTATPSPSATETAASTVAETPDATAIASAESESPATTPTSNPDFVPPALLRMEYRMDSKVAVGNIEIFAGDADRLPDFVDFAGMKVPQATLWGITALIERGYIRCEGGSAVELHLPGSDNRTVSEIKSLVTLMLQEAAMPYDVALPGSKRIRLTPEDRAMPPRTAKYTMLEVLDATVTKSADDITPEQLEILSMVFDKEQVDFILKPRYWVVTPDLIGLTEEEAVERLKEIGMVPEVIREHNPEVSQDLLGKIFYQDYSPGGKCEVGSRFVIFILTDGTEPTDPPGIK